MYVDAKLWEEEEAEREGGVEESRNRLRTARLRTSDRAGAGVLVGSASVL